MSDTSFRLVQGLPPTSTRNGFSVLLKNCPVSLILVPPLVLPNEGVTEEITTMEPVLVSKYSDR